MAAASVKPCATPARIADLNRLSDSDVYAAQKVFHEAVRMCQFPHTDPNDESDEGETQEEQPQSNKHELPYGAPVSIEGFN